MSKPRKIIDWERIEPEWRAGIKSVLQVAADYEVATGQTISHTAINKHFKSLGVTRDLSAKIRAKAKALVSVATVSALVSTETKKTDVETIDGNAEVIATVQLSQRKDIKRVRKLVMEMFEELEGVTENRELVAALVSDVEDGDMQRALKRVAELPGRADIVKKLTDALKTLVALEREAFNLDDDSNPTGAIADFLNEVTRFNKGMVNDQD